MSSWQYSPLNPDHVEIIAKKYEIKLYKEPMHYVWVAKYRIDGKSYSTLLFAIKPDEERSKQQSLQAAALMCFLWGDKNIPPPLCRDIADRYFQL